MNLSHASRLLVLVPLLVGAAAHGAELRGHGGPVRTIAVGPDGKTAITGSFDSRAIVWSLATGDAREVLLFHDSQVDAVAILPQSRFASAGADGRIAIWQAGESVPVAVLEGHAAPVAALAVSPDGSMLASASWDGTVRLWPLSGGEPRILEGHRGNVGAVVFLPDGTPVSAGYDAAVVLWPRHGDEAPVRIAMPAPVAALATAGDELFAGGVDGTVRRLNRAGEILAETQVSLRPVTALAASPEGRYVAAAGMNDQVALLDAASLKPVRTLDADGAAIWSLAFVPYAETLLGGGADHLVREWNVETGKRLGSAVAAGPADLMADYAGNPDAEVFRACVACHTLDPDDGNRAGPTLHGIFGRRIASVPGYRYSRAFREMDIVWTPETVSKLFEVGPSRYTPGTRMPEQVISDPDDRAALIRFLQAETGPD